MPFPRLLALFFGATHALVAAAGVVRPTLYGFAVGRRAGAGRVRVIAALDAPFALAVADGALRGRPLTVRLRAGAASDVARAVAFATLFPGAPRTGRAALVAASLAGASTALVLSSTAAARQDRGDDGGLGVAP